MEVANEFNNQGDYFPIWGTCLGFELMGYIENNMEEIRVDCQSNNQALPLKFKPGIASDYEMAFSREQRRRYKA